METNRFCEIILSHIPGIGPVRARVARENWGSLATMFTASEQDKVSILGQHGAQLLAQFLHGIPEPIQWAKQKEHEYISQGITCVPWSDTRYPKDLKGLSDAPICLYIKGKRIEEMLGKKNIAIVGTRKPTAYGIQSAQLFAGGLARKGICIVSGLAIGIDTVAHKKAIELGGTTIAVLGCGVDVVYPTQNRDLYIAIVEKYGLILSEFPPGFRGNRGQFVARNRIVSGISDGVLVIEGTDKSGTLSTARYGALQGKDVYAVPGSIFSELSQAPHILIKQGAQLVTHPDEVANSMGVGNRALQECNEKQHPMVKLLTQRPYSPSELAEHTGQTMQSVLEDLTMLELEGVVQPLLDGTYTAVR